MSQLVFCRNCGEQFSTDFGSDSYFGEVCSELCFLVFEEKRQAELKEEKYLSIAELDYCESLDVWVEKLYHKSDIVIDRWRVPPHLYDYFRGPPPSGWPNAEGLDFPIATLRNGVKEIRVFGLDRVITLIEDLLQPCFQKTRVVTRASLQGLLKKKSAN